MGDSSTTCFSYPDMLNKFRERRNEAEILLPLMSKVGKRMEGSLVKATSVLCFGPGPGEYDMQFIKRCLPNVKTVFAVEIDEVCLEKFKANFKQNFGDDVKLDSYHSSVEEWKGMGKKVDVIIMFHMLYEIEKGRYEHIFKDCFNQWLNDSDSFLVVVTMSNNEERINVLQRLLKRINPPGTPDLVEAHIVKSAIEKAGGNVLSSDLYSCNMDFREYGDDLAFIFYTHTGQPHGKEVIEKVIKEIVPVGGIGTYMAELILAHKKK